MIHCIPDFDRLEECTDSEYSPVCDVTADASALVRIGVSHR
jgi:hypothetical protein